MDFLDLLFLTRLRILLALYCCHLFLAEGVRRWSVSLSSTRMLRACNCHPVRRTRRTLPGLG